MKYFDYQIDYVTYPRLTKIQIGYYFVPKNLKLVRIIHDGFCNKYNKPDQYLHTVTDISVEGYLCNIFTCIEAIASWAEQEGFKNVCNYSCFFKGRNVPHFEINTKTGEKLPYLPKEPVKDAPYRDVVKKYLK